MTISTIPKSRTRRVEECGSIGANSEWLSGSLVDPSAVAGEVDQVQLRQADEPRLSREISTLPHARVERIGKR